MLILHSYHRPIEVYARDVALEIASDQPTGVIVRESPRIREFDRLSKQHDASWILDLHSEKPPYKTPPPEVFKNPYYPLVRIDYGESWKGEYHGQRSSEGAKVSRLLNMFCRNNYCIGTGDARFHGAYIEPYLATRSNPRFLHVGLLWYRSKDVSVEFIKKLANYLFSHPL